MARPETRRLSPVSKDFRVCVGKTCSCFLRDGMLVNIHGKFLLAFCLSLLISRSSFAQLPPPTVNPVQSLMQTITIYGNQSETDVTGAPYSAVERSIYSKKQPDGTYKDMTLTVTRIFRDWRGRMRSERYVTSYSSGDSPARLHSVYITDPVAGVFYRLDPDNRLATRNSWKTDEQAYADRKANGVVSRTGEPQFPLMTESLGTSTLEGLGVEGTRQTVSVPPGSLGNEREYYVIVETWSSPELKVAVLIKRDNSGLAMRTTTLTEIDRTEPDPTLFQVPADYAIVDAVGLIGYTSGAVP